MLRRRHLSRSCRRHDGPSLDLIVEGYAQSLPLGRGALPTLRLPPFARRGFVMRCRRAFTLVELLVVIAIIGVMLALLLPAVGAARASARRTHCASNLRQLGITIHQFANSHKGQFPWNVHAGQSQSWMYTLIPYAENVDAIRICPDDPKYGERLADSNKQSSYVINEYVSSSGVTGAVQSLYKVPATSKLIVLFEGADARGAFDDHAHCSTWYTAFKIANGFVWPGILAEIKPDRHGGSANYLYADGHEKIGRASCRERV